MDELVRRLKTGNIKIIFREQTDDGLVQLFRYVFVGGFAFVADWGTMVLGVMAGMNEYVAVAVAFIVGLIVNFILSKWLVFQEKSEKTNAVGEFIAYGVIGVQGLLFTELLMFVQLEWLGIHYMIAKVIAAAIVLLWNFIARKVLLYQ
jgi:putative flippase GtrA